MATTGYTDVAATYTTSGAVADTLRFTWWQNSQSITDNYTDIGWELQLIAGAYGYISSSVSKSWSVTVNGILYSGTNTVGISNNTTRKLASGTTRIYHNDDGTKTFSYSFSQKFDIRFNSWVGTKSGSGSGTLETIPRKSTMSVSNGVLGVAQTLTVSRKHSSFTHTITYECGNYSGTICTKSTNTSISFTPEMQFANGAPYGTQVYVSFKIETFNGSTSIGSNSYAIWCDIPESVKPIVDFTVTDPLGYEEVYEAYIQGRSKFKIDVEAYGVYNAPLKSYSITADGKNYTSNSVTTDVVVNSGTSTITVSVTDGRGRSTTVSKDVTVFAYEPPRITSMNIKRCDSDGSGNSSGDYLAVTFSAVVSPVNAANRAVYFVEYKKVGDTNYTSKRIRTIDDNYTVSDHTYIFRADTLSSYDVTVIAADSFTRTPKMGQGSSISVLFSAMKKGLGWAFGKIAELEGYLEVKFKSKFYDTVEIDGELSTSSKATFNAGAHVNGGLTYEIPILFSDVDTMTTSGEYYMGIDATNKPNPLNGYLSVWSADVGDYAYQQYITYTGIRYERNRLDKVWGTWNTNVHSGNMASLMTQKVLWGGGAYHMNASQTISLSEAVSSQRNGIILVWSAYSNSTAYDDNWVYQYIPKQIISLKNSNPHIITMATDGFGYIGTKKVYISDTAITGHVANSQSGEGSGLSHNNGYWVLRYVIGY